MIEPLSVLLLLLLGGWAALDGTAAGQFMISRPLVTGVLAGMLLGDPLTGLLTGAILELLHLGALPVGGCPPPGAGPGHGPGGGGGGSRGGRRRVGARAGVGRGGRPGWEGLRCPPTADGMSAGPGGSVPGAGPSRGWRVSIGRRWPRMGSGEWGTLALGRLVGGTTGTPRGRRTLLLLAGAVAGVALGLWGSGG
jgi:hypothetical protein